MTAGQDLPIRHFDQMAAFASALKALPAQMTRHLYEYEAFGSWECVLRFHDETLRVVHDGRDSVIVVQKSSEKSGPHRQNSWKSIESPIHVQSDSPLPTQEVIARIQRSILA
jgi:hypothetical protein